MITDASCLQVADRIENDPPQRCHVISDYNISISLASWGLCVLDMLRAQIGADMRREGQNPAKVRCRGSATTGLCVLDKLLVTFFGLFAHLRPCARDLFGRGSLGLGAIRVARANVYVSLLL